MLYNPKDFVLGLDEVDIIKAKDSANSRTILSQYTTIPVLKKILQGMTLKFNRIDKVNDLLEQEKLGGEEVRNRLFVCCFTHRKSEYIPHWYMYGKDAKGVRIEFYKNKGPVLESFIDSDRYIIGYKNIDDKDRQIAEYSWWNWTLPRNHDYSRNTLNKSWAFNFFQTDILYEKKYKDLYPVEYNNFIDVFPIGAIKESSWRFECETRMIAFAQSTSQSTFDNIDFILVPIKLENFKKVVVRLNPCISIEDKIEVQELCSRYGIECKNSSLTGIISY
jgi:hypothetical protein